jgi:phosphonate transport system substrate-binding protein
MQATSGVPGIEEAAYYGQETKRMKYFRSLGAAGILLLTASATCFAGAAEINFGIISTEAAATQKQNWEPFLAALSEGTGLKAHGYYASNYEGIIEAMRLNKVQIAWYGNKSAMEAVDRAEGEVFAQVVSKNGAFGYYSHLIVHTDSPIQSLGDVLKCDKSLDFGIGDPQSTSGFLAPTTYIFATENIDPKTCFKSVRNANHEANALAVADKQVHVATSNSENLERLSRSKPEIYKQIRIIWTSPLIPLDPLVWRKDLDPAIKVKLYNFLMGFGRFGTAEQNQAAREVLAGLLWAPFNPSTNDQLLTVRMLEATKRLVAIRDSDTLPADEKGKKSAAAIAEIAKIGEQRGKLASDPVQNRIEAFILAEKAGNKAELKRILEVFADSFSPKNY